MRLYLSSFRIGDHQERLLARWAGDRRRGRQDRDPRSARHAKMTTMRQDIRELVALGPLPREEAVVAGDVSQEQYMLWGERIERITPPVTDEEARALAKIFPPDGTAFGVAWTVLHLIETAPHWPLEDVLATNPPNEWIARLKRRIENAAVQHDGAHRRS